MLNYRIMLLVTLILLSACQSSRPERDESDYEGADLSGAHVEDLTDDDLVELPIDLGEVVSEGDPNFAEIDADSKASSQFPLIYNEYVQRWIVYFTGRGRKHYKRYLERSSRYAPYILKTLDEYKLPRELLYLAMIESGFNLKAASWAGAKGPWQFMRATGRQYGLKAGFWVDERRHFEKSTHAAARHLKDLHNIFDSWYLAAAAYNAGTGRIKRAIKKYKTKNFWTLVRRRRSLARETKNYVPKLIAAALIAKNYKKYGFTNLAWQKPLQFDTASVKGGVALKDIAKAAKVPYEDLKLLNSELRIGFTPPNEKNYVMRIPAGKKEVFALALPKVKSKASGSVVYHQVKRGQTLSGISHAYRSRIRAIMDLNHIRNARRLRPGMRLAIPINMHGKNDYRAIAKVSPPSRNAPKDRTNYYYVQNGDTLSEIAENHNTSISKLKRLNGMRRSRSLRAGTWLKVKKNNKTAKTNTDKSSSKKVTRKSRVTKFAGNTKNYKVKRGDSLWKIADHHNMTLGALAKLNKMSTKSQLAVGQKIRVPASNHSIAEEKQIANDNAMRDATKRAITHVVKRGDTLWSISRKYETTIAKLKRDNSIQRSRRIFPGMKLIVNL